MYGETPPIGAGEEYQLRPLDTRLYNVKEDAKIVNWREHCFLKAGFTQFAARTLAIRRDIDRVEVERMVAAGAEHVRVMAIVL
jgi:hypothetical protein